MTPGYPCASPTCPRPSELLRRGQRHRECFARHAHEVRSKPREVRNEGQRVLLELGLSLRQIADAAHCGRTTAKGWALGEYRPSPLARKALAWCWPELAPHLWDLPPHGPFRARSLRWLLRPQGAPIGRQSGATAPQSADPGTPAPNSPRVPKAERPSACTPAPAPENFG